MGPGRDSRVRVPTSSGNSPPRKFIYQVSVRTSVPKDKRLEIAGGRGAPDALVDTGHWLLPNINSVHGNRILLFNRTIEVRAGAISHGDASAGGWRERWRTTAMPSRLQAPLGAGVVSSPPPPRPLPHTSDTHISCSFVS